MIRDDLALAVRRAARGRGAARAPERRSCWTRRASATAATGPPRSRSRCRRPSAGNPLDDRRADRRRARGRRACRTWPGPRRPSPASSTSTSRPPGCTTCCARSSRRATRFGTSDALAGQRINLEFVSANPTGPLHAGGGRWVAVGDAIANLLASQGARRAPRVLPERHRQPARDVPRLAVRAVPRREAARGRLPGRVPRRPRRATCAPSSATTSRPTTPASGACSASSRASADDLDRIGVHFDTWFSERTLHERDEVGRRAARARREGRRLRRRTARAGCARPTSATRATACS